MLYPTLSQPFVALCIFITSFLSGFLFDIANLALLAFKQNKIIKNIFYAISTFFATFLLFLTNFYTNYGQFRFFIVVIFIGSIVLQRFIIGKPLSKLYSICYNKYIKNLNRGKRNGEEREADKSTADYTGNNLRLNRNHHNNSRQQQEKRP